MIEDRVSAFNDLRNAILERISCFEGDTTYATPITIAAITPLGSTLDWILTGGYVTFVWRHIFSSYFNSINPPGDAYDGTEQWRWVMSYDASDMASCMALTKADFSTWCLDRWGLDLASVTSASLFSQWLRDKITIRPVGEVLDLLNDILLRLRVRVRMLGRDRHTFDPAWAQAYKSVVRQSADNVNSNFQAAAWRTGGHLEEAQIKVSYSSGRYGASAYCPPDDGANPPLDNLWYGNTYLQARSASLSPCVAWANDYTTTGDAPGDLASLAAPYGVAPASTARPFGGITASTFGGITIRTGIGAYSETWELKSIVSLIDCSPLLTQTI